MRTIFSVTPNYATASGGFAISIGTRRLHYARTYRELTTALKHYYFGTEPHDKRVCPFCKDDKR